MTVGLVLVGTAAVPAGAASRPHAKAVTPTSFLAKTLHPASVTTSAPAAASARAAAEEGPGGEDESAEELRARGEFLRSIVAAPAVTSPVAGLLAATAAARKLPQVGGSWNEVTDKPFFDDPIERGANYGVGFYFVTGRMTSLTGNGSVVYAGAASGGVWRSTNQGAKWVPYSKGLPRLAVGALATNSADHSVWVGTGEANNASENQYGVGVYRLAKGSNTWRRVGGNELNGAGVFRIVLIRGYVYAATSHGLYRHSLKAKASSAWQLVLAPAGPVAYPPSSSVTDVIAVPGSKGKKVFAVVGWSGYTNPPATENNGFYVGSGARGSFKRVTPTGDINPATIGRTSLASGGGWLYAVASDTTTGDIGKQGAYVSTSGNPAGPWTKIADKAKLQASGSALGPDVGYQADYNQAITVDPKNRQHVYLQLEEVFESTDGGQTWATVGPYWNFDIPCEQANGNPYACPPTTHPDQHAGMIYAGQFWAGSDGGVWRRPLSWHAAGHWTDLNPTLYTTQNYSIAVGKTPHGLAYWGGLQDNGESYTRPDLPHVEQAFTGDGGDTIVDPRNGDRAVEEYIFNDMYLTTDAAVTTLREISPSCVSATNPPAVCDPNPRFIAPIEMDVRNPDHWVTGGQYVWDDTKSWNTVCSKTEGCDWQKVYDTGAGNQTTALAANGKVTYAAWCGGGDGCNPPAFRRGLATNYGGAWHELSLKGVPNRYITSIAVDPKNAAHVYLSVGSYSRRWIPTAGYGHVFESTNGGKTWRDVSGNLPDAPVYKVVLHGKQLVVGTEVGAFVGTVNKKGHGSWARLGRNLPNVTVWDLTVAPDGRIVAGTHGRGDWEIKLR